MKEPKPKNYGWVNVVVFRYPSPTNPIIVNVYGYETKAEAVASQRRAKRHLAEDLPEYTDRLIANRVRPVLVEGIDFGYPGEPVEAL